MSRKQLERVIEAAKSVGELPGEDPGDYEQMELFEALCACDAGVLPPEAVGIALQNAQGYVSICTFDKFFKPSLEKTKAGQP